MTQTSKMRCDAPKKIKKGPSKSNQNTLPVSWGPHSDNLIGLELRHMLSIKGHPQDAICMVDWVLWLPRVQACCYLMLTDTAMGGPRAAQTIYLYIYIPTSGLQDDILTYTVRSLNIKLTIYIYLIQSYTLIYIYLCIDTQNPRLALPPPSGPGLKA